MKNDGAMGPWERLRRAIPSIDLTTVYSSGAEAAMLGRDVVTVVKSDLLVVSQLVRRAACVCAGALPQAAWAKVTEIAVTWDILKVLSQVCPCPD